MELIRVFAVVIMCLYAVVMALTAYYYHFQRVRKLENTRLHYIMLWLLQSSLLLMIVYQIIIVAFPVSYAGEGYEFTKAEIIVLYILTLVFAAQWGLNNAAHTTYTTYYWILVKKVEAHMQQKAL